jgi:hypothetical protein
MTRKIALPLILLATPLLGGCAVQAAMIAADIAQDIPRSQGPSNAHLKPQAREACSQQAARYGSVYVVDVEQRYPDRLIVWGSVTDAQQQRRTFECHYTNAVKSFRVRDIAPAAS